MILSTWKKIPTLFSSYAHWLHLKWPAGKVERLPVIQPDGSTHVPGLYIAGDLTGIPLLKLAIQSGSKVVKTIAQDAQFQKLRHTESKPGIDLLIVGAGIAGVAAALEAEKQQIPYQLFESSRPFATIADFPEKKPIFAYPLEEGKPPSEDFQIVGDTKEELLTHLLSQIHSLEIQKNRLLWVEKKSNHLLCHFETGEPIKALRVILAIGKSGDYRKLNIPGETLGKVHHQLHDPAQYKGKKVLVVGGGDSALETAISLAKSGADTVLSYRGKEFSRPKPELLSQIQDLAKTRALQVYFESEPVEILEQTVVLKTPTQKNQVLENDTVFVMIGRLAPLQLLRKSRVPIGGEWRLKNVLFCGLFLLFCLALYNVKSDGFLGRLLKERNWFPTNLHTAAFDPNAMPSFFKILAISASHPGFWYTLLYSALVVYFGIKRIKKRKTDYIKWQTISLMAVQVVPLFILPELLLPWLGSHHLLPEGMLNELFPKANYDHGREYWRSYGLILAWPLFIYNVFTAQPMWGWLAISLVQTFVLIPILIYFFGKGSYCGWICSCGALAETLGDSQRQKMVHGPKSNRLNLVGQAILVFVSLLFVLRIVGWIFPQVGINDFFKKWVLGESWFSYKWIVDVFLAGVLAVGVYFWFSGRVWCRFFCPLAALMHIYARFSRFRIFSDKKKCISCNVCTSVCHMGIDVMNFANKGIPMEDPECVRCSACVSSCPTEVLSFGQLKKDGPSYDSLSARLVQIQVHPSKRKQPTLQA